VRTKLGLKLFQLLYFYLVGEETDPFLSSEGDVQVLVILLLNYCVDLVWSQNTVFEGL
jgi:hypothetical protein